MPEGTRLDPRQPEADRPVEPPTPRPDEALTFTEAPDPRNLPACGMSPERFQDRFEFYTNQPQQVSGVWLLYDAIRALPGGCAVLDEQAAWARKFSEKPPAPAFTNPLSKVPYFSQLDNASGQGARECFSSSCAMAAAFHGKVKSDDEYNTIRARYGDTTDASAQVAALRSLGLDARFVQNATIKMLEDEILAGRPTPCGWLHKGHVSAPSGGGHWGTMVGFDSTNWIMHDPFGVALMVQGGYTNDTNGAYAHYTRQSFNPRWIVGGDGDGWMMIIKP